MLLRLREFPAGRYWFVLLSLLPLPSLCSSPAMEVVYAPEVVFRGEPLTFRVAADPAEPVVVATNGVEFVRSAGSEVREITLRPREAMTLGFFDDAGAGWSFRLLRPDEPAELSESDGFLVVGDTPAILLPDHRLPPPLDRRWETVEMIENALLNKKPPLETAHLFAPISSTLDAQLRSLFGAERVVVERPAEEAWFRVHGHLLRLERAPRPFVAVEMDFLDLERGMPFHIWLMKWQFTLQRLKALGGYEDGLLFGPEYGDTTRNWRPIMHEQLQSLARAHGLGYVDRSIPPEVWRERLAARLSERYTLP